MTLLKYQSLLILLVLLSAFVALAQQTNEGTTRPMPKEVRGYKIHRAQVEMKKPSEPGKKKPDKKSEKEKFDYLRDWININAGNKRTQSDCQVVNAANRSKYGLK